MTMNSRLRPRDRPGAFDDLALMLARPRHNAPGERGAYASAPVDLPAIAAPTATGTQLAATFNRESAAAIGVARLTWGTIGPQSGASSRARTTRRDLARLGYLMLMDGRWPAAGAQRPVVSQGRGAACGCGSAVYARIAGSPFLPPATAPEP